MLKDLVSIKKYSLISNHFFELMLLIPAYELFIKKNGKSIKTKLLIDNSEAEDNNKIRKLMRI